MHGSNGLGGYEFAANTKEALVSEFAPAFMAEIIENSEEPVTIVALGALTNIAVLLLYRPDLKEKIEKIVFMGTCMPNTLILTANVRYDPEACRVVLHSGVPFYAFPRTTSFQAYLGTKEFQEIAEIDNEVARMISYIFSVYSCLLYTSPSPRD